MRHRLIAAAVVAAAPLIALAGPARATAPGLAGVIGYEVPTSKGVALYSIEATGTRPAQLTNFKGVHTTVEFSPDGKRIAYAAFKGDKPFEIYVANADGSSPKRITNNKSFSIAPSWSPDSKHIVYTAPDPEAVSEDESFQPLQLRIVKPNGKGDSAVDVDGQPQGTELLDPVWTPDGKTIVACMGKPDKKFPKAQFSLVSVAAKGGKLRKLTGRGGVDELNPSVSPDGGTIAYEVAARFSLKQSDIAVISINGGRGDRLTTTPAFETNPVWSPDGSRMALTSDRDGKKPGKERLSRDFELYTMAADGTDFVRLTDDNVPNLFPDWQSLPAR